MAGGFFALVLLAAFVLLCAALIVANAFVRAGRAIDDMFPPELSRHEHDPLAALRERGL